jgi:epoxyqueuosine reductase
MAGVLNIHLRRPGNTGNREAVPVLSRTMEHEPEPLIRSHAAWALGVLGGPIARRTLELGRRREADSDITSEIALALEML